MAKDIDFTGDVVKNSITETMNKVIAYHTKNWREGNELRVGDYAENLCNEELDKWLGISQKDTITGPLYNYIQDPTSSKYIKIFERWLLQYGPYIMTLALEYVSARDWRNRYNVSDEKRSDLIHQAGEMARKRLLGGSI